VNGDVHFVSDFNAREIHQSGIEDDPLRVSDFGDGLGHGVILCFTGGRCQTTGAEKLKAEKWNGSLCKVIGDTLRVIGDLPAREASVFVELRRDKWA
jgi:hypothetical protein